MASTGSSFSSSSSSSKRQRGADGSAVPRGGGSGGAIPAEFDAPLRPPVVAAPGLVSTRRLTRADGRAYIFPYIGGLARDPLSDAQFVSSKAGLFRVAPTGVVTLLAGGGVKVGVTVDPVKIDSLEQFGTPEQTAERVLAVEEGRDGVKSVTLRELRAESSEGEPTYYNIEYATLSSRGKKLFCCKYCIANRRLYVLQVQAKLDDFDADRALRDEVRAVAGSFRVG